MQIESRSYHTTISPGRGIFVCTDGTETEAVVEFIRKRVYVFMFIQSRNNNNNNDERVVELFPVLNSCFCEWALARVPGLDCRGLS